MKIAIDRQTLCDAVAHVSRAVSTKSTIPALEGIMLMAEGEKLTMVAYNLEIGMTKVLAARVEEPGEVILNAKLFGDIVRRLPGDMVSLTVDERLMCQITSGSAKFDILGISTAEFPEMPSLTESQALVLPGEVLQGMVRQTIFAVAQNDAKPVHTGILFEIEGGEIRLVAVDGFRLAIRKEPLAVEEDMRFIVAGKAMSEVVKLITDETEEVVLRVGKRHISFEIPHLPPAGRRVFRLSQHRSQSLRVHCPHRHEGSGRYGGADFLNHQRPAEKPRALPDQGRGDRVFLRHGHGPGSRPLRQQPRRGRHRNRLQQPLSAGRPAGGRDRRGLHGIQRGLRPYGHPAG